MATCPLNAAEPAGTPPLFFFVTLRFAALELEAAPFSAASGRSVPAVRRNTLIAERRLTITCSAESPRPNLPAPSNIYRPECRPRRARRILSVQISHPPPFGLRHSGSATRFEFNSVG